MKDILVVMTKRVSLLPEKDFRVDFCVFNCLLDMYVRNENSSQIRKFEEEEEEEEEVKEVKFNQQGRNGTQTDFDE